MILYPAKSLYLLSFLLLNIVKEQSMVTRSRNKKQEAISLIKRKENIFLSTFYNDDYPISVLILLHFKDKVRL